LTWRVTRGYERPHQAQPALDLKAIWHAVIDNKVFLPIIGIYAFAGASFNSLSAAAVYYFTYYHGYDETQISLLLGVWGGMALVWVPVLSLLGQKIGKRRTIIYVYALTATVFACLWFLEPMGGKEIGWLVVLMSLASCVAPALVMIGKAMIADSVEVDEFRTGHRREGVYFSVASFIQKLAIALVLWGSGIILEQAGYVANAVQSDAAITAIKALISWIPAALIAASIIFALFSTMTKEKHAALLRALDLKKAGKEYDIEPIRDLVT